VYNVYTLATSKQVITIWWRVLSAAGHRVLNINEMGTTQ